MAEPLMGIHHVTAIASDPQRNLDFYTGTLGMRLVKLTVNFDDPGTYHFYFADGLGTPGTIMTFFPWPGARQGRPGAGQIGATAFSVPVNALGFWRDRLTQLDIEITEESRFDQEVLVFTDPAGMTLEIAGDSAVDAIPGWEGGPVPAEHAIRGFHSVTLWEADADITDTTLRSGLGFAAIDEAGARTRYHITEPGIGARVDVLHLPETPPASGGAGTVHHVAWRTADRDRQQEWQARVSARGLHVTDILDRQYFTSIYFREPGGVLFEIATDPPGFTFDEAPEDLGSALRLPPWYEKQRSVIETVLPKLQLPGRESTRG